MPKLVSDAINANAERNKQFVEDSWKLLRRRRDVDNDVSNYQGKMKNEAKKFSFFRFLMKKTEKVGRYGGRRLEEKEDSIKAMDESSTPVGVYFDPLGLKTIKAKNVENWGSDDVEALDTFNDDAATIQNDFTGRVEAETENTRENDFERHLIGNEMMSMGEELELRKHRNKENLSNEYLKRFADKFNAGRAFEPDEEITEDVPDSFSVELMVDDPPPDYSLEWEMYQADQTKSFGAKMKGFFRKMFKIKAPSQDDLFNNFVKSLPEYKRLENEGRQKATEAGVEYDPENDSDLLEFKSNLSAIQEAKSNGHSLVRLNAIKNGKKLSRYSFMFGVLGGSGGVAGAVFGTVSNPVNKSKEPRIGTEMQISYPNFLRAAAKVRGVAGSMRSYSFMRYNCTSFAAEVAQAAGIPMRAEDTSAIMLSHRHRAMRVDNPYTLMKFIRAENMKQQGVSNEKEYNEDRNYDGTDGVKSQYDPSEDQVNTLATSLYNQYADRVDEFDSVQIMIKRGLAEPAVIARRFGNFCIDIVRTAMRIDNSIPIDELTGDALINAQQARNKQKLATIGATTVQGAVERFFNDDNQEASDLYLLKNDMKINVMKRKLLANSVGNLEPDSLDTYLEKFVGYGIVRDKYKEVFSSKIVDMSKISKAGKKMLEWIIDWQENTVDSLLKGLDKMSTKDFFETLDFVMDKTDLNLLGTDMLKDEASLKNFFAETNLKLPEYYDFDDEARVEKAREDAKRRREEQERQREEQEKEVQRLAQLEEEEKRRKEEERKAEEIRLAPIRAAEANKKEPKQVDLPSRITKAIVKEMLKSLPNDSEDELTDVFIDIFSKSCGIEGRGISTRRKISLPMQIKDFIAVCGRKTDAFGDIAKCYQDIMASDSRSACKELFIRMYRSIDQKLPKDAQKLKSIFDDAGMQ